MASRAGGAACILNFGLMIPRDGAEVVAAWTSFVDRIGDEVKCRVEPVIGTSAEIVEKFKRGKLDLAWLGNAPALDVVESGEGEVFAQLVTPDGRTGYRSLLIVHRDSALHELDDVQQQASRLRFGDGERTSTSGHLVPLYYAFIRRGINDPLKLFRSTRNSSTRVNLGLVERREVDVATTNDVELDLLRRQDPDAAGRLRVIWESPDIPQSPLLWSLKLPAELRKKIRAAVLGFPRAGSAADKAIQQRSTDFSAFRKSSNYQLIRAADLEMFTLLKGIDNDPQLSFAEKSARGMAVSQRASALELRLRLLPSLP